MIHILLKEGSGIRPGTVHNAVIESWDSTLEFELRRMEQFATKADARATVAGWIEDYNHDRRHSALGMRSPIAYERSHTPPRTHRNKRRDRAPRFRLPSVAPSSPGSTPSPAGGLRPALNPAAGGTPRTAAGTRHEERAQNKIHQLEVSTLSGDGHATNPDKKVLRY